MIRTRSGLNMTSPDTLKDKLKETGSSVSVSAAQLETRMSKMRKFLYAILLLGTVLYGTMLMTQSSISTYTRRKHVSTDEESITVVMNTFKRHDLMIGVYFLFNGCPPFY